MIYVLMDFFLKHLLFMLNLLLVSFSAAEEDDRVFPIFLTQTTVKWKMEKIVTNPNSGYHQKSVLLCTAPDSGLVFINSGDITINDTHVELESITVYYLSTRTIL